MQKNVAGQKWTVFAFDRTDNTPKTGDAANITANLRIDGGAANAVDDTNPTELEDGYYIFDITQAESNGENIVIAPVSSTSDIQVIGVPGVVYTTPPNFPDMGIESDGDLTQVNTCVSNTDMRGTNGANTTVPDAAGVAPTAVENRQEMDSNSIQLAKLGTPAADISADVAAVKAETALIVADTNELQTDDIPGLIAALNDISAAQVNAECDTAISDAALATAAALAIVDAVADAIKVVTDSQARASASIADGAAVSGTLSVTEMTTDLTIAVAEQLKGRKLIFAYDTTTAALRGQATNITDVAVSGSKLTFTAITTAPVVGDIFSVV